MLKSLPIPSKRLQPRAYHAFRCIGADCEDTCCIGWQVNVDKNTYEAYGRCEDPNLGPRLRELVTINVGSTSDESYARIGLSGASCPFLADGLCGIQIGLGETYLSTVCAKFPRVASVVDDVLERSLDLSCPEAARLMLLDPNPMQFDDEEGPLPGTRLGLPSVLTTAGGNSRKPYTYFREIRSFLIELLQYRAYPLSKRLVILGSFCDQLEQLAAAGLNAEVPAAVRWFREAIHGNLLDAAIGQHSPRPVVQLSILLELIVARITAEFVSPRFLECYREFTDGIQWSAESSMEEIAERYAAAFSGPFAPFLSRHEHMLEHYLVNYVHRTQFPLGPQQDNRDIGKHRTAETIPEHCLLMLVYYGVIQTVLIGLAAFHGAEFGPSHAIRVIQSVTKAFEHNLAFPERALKILAEKGVRNCVSMAILVRN
jgi:lysine-N-methylase